LFRRRQFVVCWLNALIVLVRTAVTSVLMLELGGQRREGAGRSSRHDEN
jgi:hypothetical protein